ncbi:MAG: hypothetical protein ACREJ4_05420, partial [Candidatus Methylomirabilaceae bacterium]
MKKQRRDAAASKATPHQDDSEFEGLLLDIVAIARREEHSRRYAEALERLLVEKGVVREDILDPIVAEA